MTISSTPFENLPHKAKILKFASTNDFKSVIDILTAEGIPDDQMGETLFSYSNYALSEQRHNTAIRILLFLITALEDPSEASSLYRQIGDIYSLIGRYDDARNYYGKLPLTFENIERCLFTYLHRCDIEGILILRDQLIKRVPQSAHEQINVIVGKVMTEIISRPEILNAHKQLYEKNKAYIKHIWPFPLDKLKPHSVQVQFSAPNKPTIVSQLSTMYWIKHGIWTRTTLKTEKSSLPDNSHIIVYCKRPDTFFSFLKKLETETPNLIKTECWVIIDLYMLRSLMGVFDFSVFINCSYILKIIDVNKLDSQITHLLMDKKLPFINQACYLTPEDAAFFSQKVVPIFNRCQAKLNHRIQAYEKMLPGIFPDSYARTVRSKIGSKEKVKILFFTSRFTTYMQFSTRDIAEGFRKLGHKTFIEIEKEDSGVSIRKDVCLENLINYQPDIIFSINHFRTNYPWIPETIPFVTWVQDLMPYILNFENQALLKDTDYIFSFSKSWIDHFFKTHRGFKNKEVHFLPVSVDTDTYFPIPNFKKKYDITFISHLPNIDETYLPLLQGKTVPEITSDSARVFMTEIVNILDGMSFTQVFNIQGNEDHLVMFLNKVSRQLKLPVSSEVISLTKPRDAKNAYSRFTKHMFMLLKSQPIKSLLAHDINVKVFGNNWEALAPFTDHAMGVVKNGKELNEVINSSRINLNLSPGTSYHMKVPEVISAGGFILTRRLPKEMDTMPISDFFIEGKEIILFNDETDLINTALYFLENSDKRNKIAKAAYDKFKKKYGVTSSARKILKAITKNS